MAVQRKHPYANFNFLVDLGLEQEVGFAEVELPAAEIETIEYREGGEPTSGTRKLPGRVRYGNVVLRRGVDGNLELWEWFRTVRDGQVERRNVTITLLDEAHAPVLRWRLRDAFPVKLEASNLDAQGNEVVIETLELTHEGLELD